MTAPVPIEAKWAWIAGVIEGDGCFTTNSERIPKVMVVMTDEDVIRRLHTWSGVGVVYGPRVPRTGHNKQPLWYWTVTARAEVRALIDAVAPWLGKRRLARAMEVYEIASVASKANNEKTHCLQGHELLGDNLYVWRGKRSCRVCRAQRARTYRGAQR